MGGVSAPVCRCSFAVTCGLVDGLFALRKEIDFRFNLWLFVGNGEYLSSPRARVIRVRACWLYRVQHFFKWILAFRGANRIYTRSQHLESCSTEAIKSFFPATYSIIYFYKEIISSYFYRQFSFKLCFWYFKKFNTINSSNSISINYFEIAYTYLFFYFGFLII